MILMIGCAGTTPNEKLSLSERLELGLDYLDEEKYLQAQDEFNLVLIRATGTELGDDAQFFLGESYFLNKEKLMAEDFNDKFTGIINQINTFAPIKSIVHQKTEDEILLIEYEDVK